MSAFHREQLSNSIDLKGFSPLRQKGRVSLQMISEGISSVQWSVGPSDCYQHTVLQHSESAAIGRRQTMLCCSVTQVVHCCFHSVCFVGQTGINVIVTTFSQKKNIYIYFWGTEHSFFCKWLMSREISQLSLSTRFFSSHCSGYDIPSIRLNKFTKNVYSNFAGT